MVQPLTTNRTGLLAFEHQRRHVNGGAKAFVVAGYMEAGPVFSCHARGNP
jgi:hypothetical protein